MHILPVIQPFILPVEFKGKRYEVHFDGSGAFVPPQLGSFLIAERLAVQGHQPDPQPRWERNGDGWGKAIPLYSPWVVEK